MRFAVIINITNKCKMLVLILMRAFFLLFYTFLFFIKYLKIHFFSESSNSGESLDEFERLERECAEDQSAAQEVEAEKVEPR